jgi:hypothetical protein
MSKRLQSALVGGLALLVACGDGSPTGGATNTGSGTGTGTGTGTGASVTPYDPAFPPMVPQVWKGSGEVLSAPQVIPVFWSGDTMQSQLTTFLSNYLVRSTSWTALAEYGIGRGTVGNPAVIATAPASQLDEAGVQNLVLGRIQDGTLPRPDANTLYTLYFPLSVTLLHEGGTSCVDFAGYHTAAKQADGTRVAIAVIPRCRRSTLALLTYATSHELAEAAADPYLAAWNTMRDPYVLWSVPLHGAELGDLCENLVDAAYNESGVGVVTRLFSNAAMQAYKNPCLPAPSGASFFSVARPTELRTVSIGSDLHDLEDVPVPAGQTRAIEVRSMSDLKPGPSWTVEASEVPLGGAAKVLSFAWQEAPGQTKATTRDGATLHLLVTASPTASTGFTTVLLTSTATTGTGAQTQTMWVQTVALTR